MTNRRLIGFVLLLSLTASAQAHFIWLERDGDGPARAYFGEWHEDVRERAGGALDRIKATRAFAQDAGAALPVARRADHLEIAAKTAGDIRLVEAGLAPREDKKNGGKTRTVFHAKAGRAETAAKLDLELVPEAPGSERFTLLYRGAPLAKAEVTVYGPPKWEKVLRTDDQGRVSVPTPWKGRYVIEATHIEDQPGEANGETYDRIRNVFTLSFVSREGKPW